mgnify:FL=1
MKTLRKAVSLLERNQIQGEFDSFQLLEDAAFQNIREKHRARRYISAEHENLGCILLLALIGAPGSFVAWAASGDAGYLCGFLFWLIVGVPTYYYLVYAARYWREHYAIIAEENRRYGQASFG